MPLYAYFCPQCGREVDAFRSVSERHPGPLCCGDPMRINIVPAAVQGDLPGYQSPVTGKWIDGRVARREDLKASGSRPWEGMASERAEAARRVKYADEKLDRKLDATVRETLNSMTPAKRRLLERGT